MQENYLYEYAVIRLMPKVEREEFINIGVILYSKEANYIRVHYQFDKDKISCFMGDVDAFDWDILQSYLEAYDKVCMGDKQGGRIAEFSASERFGWLTAVRSTIIQTSRPHPGFSKNLDQTLECLFEDLVL